MVIKVTGKSEVTGKRSVNSLSPGCIVGFGPDEFTPADALYDETLGTPMRTYARSEGNVVDIAGTIGKGILGVLKGIGERGRAYARPEDILMTVPVPYGGVSLDGEDNDIGSVGVTPADQRTLSKLTGITKKYLYGAAVTTGRLAGIYIDEDILEDAQEYLRLYTEKRWNEAKKYAGNFVEFLKTKGHEISHFKFGVNDEGVAEWYGQMYLKKLAEKYRPVRDAVRNAYMSYRDRIRDTGFDLVAGNFRKAGGR
jgi:hypothetical protein